MSSLFPPAAAKEHLAVATVQHGNSRMHHSYSARSLGNEMGGVRLMKSRSTCDTSIQECLGMQERLRKIQCLEAEGKEAALREQNLLQQLYDKRAHLIKKGSEVCDLQVQLAQELRDKQELLHRAMERDMKILCIQESLAGSTVRASDADQKRLVPTTAAESHTGSNVGRLNSAKCFRDMPPTNLHSKSVPTVAVLTNQDVTFSPHPQGAWKADQASTPPISTPPILHRKPAMLLSPPHATRVTRYASQPSMHVQCVPFPA